MTITPQQKEEMLEAARPLIKWLNDNVHPHCRAVVDWTSIELLESFGSHSTEAFLNDPLPKDSKSNA